MFFVFSKMSAMIAFWIVGGVDDNRGLEWERRKKKKKREIFI